MNFRISERNSWQKQGWKKWGIWEAPSREIDNLEGNYDFSHKEIHKTYSRKFVGNVNFFPGNLHFFPALGKSIHKPTRVDIKLDWGVIYFNIPTELGTLQLVSDISQIHKPDMLCALENNPQNQIIF